MMVSWGKTNWYAIQSKPHHENSAGGRVAMFGVDVFLAKIKQEQLICGPLLVFEMVRYAQGVLRVVGSKRYPIPLKDETIRSIRVRIQEDGFILPIHGKNLKAHRC